METESNKGSMTGGDVETDLNGKMPATATGQNLQVDNEAPEQQQQPQQVISQSSSGDNLLADDSEQQKQLDKCSPAPTMSSKEIVKQLAKLMARDQNKEQRIAKLEADKLERSPAGTPSSTNAADHQLAQALSAKAELEGVKMRNPPASQQQQQYLPSSSSSSKTAILPSDGGTALLKKARDDRHTRNIDMNSSCFVDFVRNSDSMADRSMFIPDLLNVGCDKIKICLPAGVGKTIALTMAKAFFEHVLDAAQPEKSNNFALFFDETQFQNGARFQVTKDASFCKEHFGRYNVIYISLGLIKGTSTIISAMLGETLKQLFIDFEPLIGDFLEQKVDNERRTVIAKREKDLELYCKYVQQIPRAEWCKSFILLSRLLFEASGATKRQLIILLDDYDTPIVERRDFSRSEEWNNVCTLVEEFVTALRCAQHVKLLVLAGVFNFPVSCDDFAYFGVETRRPMTITADNAEEPKTSSRTRPNLTRYFGFTEQEFHAYCSSFAFPKHLWPKAEKYLNGYAISEDFRLFNTWSTMMLLNDPHSWHCQWAIHYKQSTFMTTMNPLFRHESTAEQICKLINGEHFPADDPMLAYFNANNIAELRKHSKTLSVCARGKNSEIKGEVVSLFMRFLHTSGYLVLAGDNMRIPNEEVRSLLKMHIKQDFFVQKYNFDIGLTNAITDRLVNLIYHRHTDEKPKLETALVDMLESFTKEHGLNEHHLHVVFEFATFRVRDWSFYAGDYAIKGSKCRPDIILCNEDLGVAMCVELKYGRNDKEHTPFHALRQIYDSHYFTTSEISRMQKLDRLYALGINSRLQNDDLGWEGGFIVSIQVREAQREKTMGIADFLKNFEDSLKKFPGKKTSHSFD